MATLAANGWRFKVRLFRAVVAAGLVAAVSGVSPLLAESAGWVSGHAIDAAGRPLPHLRVELLKAFQGQPVGVPLQANVTDGRGAWTFSGVSVGDYVVRMVYRGRTAGVPVSVAEASEVPGVLIVAPSLPPGRLLQGQAAAAAAATGGLNTLAVVGTIVAVASAATVVVVLRDES